MQDGDRHIRKVPVLALVISLFYGLGALVGLFNLLHPGSMRVYQHFVFEQSPTYKILYVLMELCFLAGAVLLWTLKPAAFPCFVAALLLSVVSHILLLTLHVGAVFGFLGILLQIAVTAYVWWAINRRGHPAHGAAFSA